MKAALHDGSKFEKQLLVHLLCVFQMDLNFLARLNCDEIKFRKLNTNSATFEVAL